MANDDKAQRLIAGAITLIDLLEHVIIPEIEKLASTGEITAAEQQATLDRYSTLRDNLDERFETDPWRTEQEPPASPPA